MIQIPQDIHEWNKRYVNGSREKKPGFWFHKSLTLTMWGQTHLTQYTASNCGHWQTYMTFKDTSGWSFLWQIIHGIQKSAVKRLPQLKVTCNPPNLITTKNQKVNPSLIYIVPFLTHLYFLLPQNSQWLQVPQLNYIPARKSRCGGWESSRGKQSWNGRVPYSWWSQEGCHQNCYL